MYTWGILTIIHRKLQVPPLLYFVGRVEKPCLLCLMIESKEEKSYILWANTKERSEERPRKRLKRNGKKTLPRQKPYCLFMNKILIWKNIIWWSTKIRLCVFLWRNFWRLRLCLCSFSISCLLKDFSTFENENSSLPRSRLKVLEAALVIEIIFHFLVFLWMRLFFVIEICREEISLVRPLISRFWGLPSFLHYGYYFWLRIPDLNQCVCVLL